MGLRLAQVAGVREVDVRQCEFKVRWRRADSGAGGDRLSDAWGWWVVLREHADMRGSAMPVAWRDSVKRVGRGG